MQFAEGTLVKYKQHIGTIAFVDDGCLTICIARNEHKSTEVRIVVYRSEFKDIELFKQSQK
jgi:hypothetical protein